MLMRLSSTPRWALPFALAAALRSGPVCAQTTAQIPLQFDFMNPGARSLAMGSAFVGAADDATAAFHNPGGLPLPPPIPQASVEGRFRSTTTPFLYGGRVNGLPTGVAPDTLSGPTYGRDVDHHFGPGFLSLVVPLSSLVRHHGGDTGSAPAPGDAARRPMIDRWTFAAYRHEVVSVTNSFFSSGPFERTTFAGVTDDANRALPLGGTRSIDIVNYGVAAGYRVQDWLAVGAGVSWYTFDLDAQFARYNVVSTIYSAPDLSNPIATAVQHGSDVSATFNAGAVWVASPQLQIGAAFRRGPRFEFTQHDTVLGELSLTRSGRFKLPDVAAVGIRWERGGNLRVVVDYDRVWYSQLKADFIDIQAISTGRQDQLTIDDGNEVHGGIEYIFLQLPKAVAVRGGAWYDPAHAVRYVPTARGDSTDALLSAALTGGKNVVHGTGGAGIVLSDHLEVNGAVDASSQTTYVVVSAVIRF